MTYQPYLIANTSTGIDKQLQPWLIPDDAQQDLFDGYVYRGTLSKRQGYRYFATGEREMQPYTESRIVHTPVALAPATGVINGTNKVFTFTFTTPVRRGTITINGSNPVQVVTDDGMGGFTGAIDPIGVNTIDYITGAATVTFLVAPAGASTVLATYAFFPDQPVMMVANFYTANNTRQLIVADIQYVNRYNPNLNILEDITVTPYTRVTDDHFNFFSWVNYPDANFNPRLIFTNNKDVVQSYDGTTIAAYTYNMQTTQAVPETVTALKALLVFQVKDRLVFLRTTETSASGTKTYPQRIRISGTGANSDDFRTSATGAGVIDISDQTWIMGASFNRDDLVIFTESSTWVMKYTGNDTTPFVLNKLDETRGSDAPFGVITYLNRTTAASKRGLIISDGYRVERQDQKIPDFSFDEVDQNNFALCYAGTVDEDRDHYLAYPSSGQTTSNRILTTNYDEDNYAIYRFPLSCMGRFQLAYDVTWNDLLGYKNWADLANDYKNWQSFNYDEGSPFTVGGGQHGEIWRLAVPGEDNEVRIYNITQIDIETLEITSDYMNYSLNTNDDTGMGADYIFFTAIEGMVELNGKQYPIIQAGTYTFRVRVPSNVTFSAYTSGGRAARVIPFNALFKKFNPYVDSDKKVRCGWLYMYVDSSGTELTRNVLISDITQANPCVISTQTNHGFQTNDQINIFSVLGMTELNDIQYFITVINANTFSLNGINSTGFTPYISGGIASVSERAKMDIQITTDDNQQVTQLNNNNPVPYQGSVTNLVFQDGFKKWYKVFINQTGIFIQFRFKNTQAGSTINVQATMPGFQPLGRLL